MMKLNCRHSGVAVWTLAAALALTACDRPSASPTAAADKLASQPDAATAPGTNALADQAWQALQAAATPPPVPAEWNGREPTPEQANQFRARQGHLAGVAADQAAAFLAKFPADSRADAARRLEWQLLDAAVRLGNTNRLDRLEALEQARLKDPATSDDERFSLRVRATERTALAQQAGGMPAVMAQLEKGLRELQKEFPQRNEIFNMLMTVAENSPKDKALALAREIMTGTPDPQLKMLAELLGRRTEALDKPLGLKLRATDGREIDFAKLKGKVVLLDFWATRCPPCVALMPKLKELYDKYHAQGFEIVGINSDEDKAVMLRFLEKEKATWLQYWDGGESGVGGQLGIYLLPSLWLLDKQGLVRDNEALHDLEAKIQKLLAE